MEAIIEKIKEYKIIVICTGLGLLVGGFFLLKPAPQISVKETNLQAEVAAVSKDSSTEKEVKKEEKEEPLEQELPFWEHMAYLIEDDGIVLRDDFFHILNKEQ